jgi:hypothetical protein
MVVFSNHRLGPSAEILLSPEVATAMLRETAACARATAAGRWELELVAWLDDQSHDPETLDVGDIAWTPDHFDAQRRFLTDAILAASTGSAHEAALRRWAQQIETHPRDSVRVGRRWIWQRVANA